MSVDDAGAEEWGAIAARAAASGATNATATPLDWPHAQVGDEQLLADSLGVHEAVTLGVGGASSGLASLMPHGSAYFLRTMIVLLSPLVIAIGLTLFWLLVDAIDGCLYESEYPDEGTGK